MSKYILKLYITGNNMRSLTAVNNLRRLCSEHLRGIPEIEIVDIMTRPDIAELDKIFATPTLIKKYPNPERRIIGDLSNTKLVMAELGFELEL